MRSQDFEESRALSSGARATVLGGSRGGRKAFVAAALGVASWLVAGFAHAATARDPLDQAEASSIAEMAPHALELLEAGEGALEQGDAEKAIASFVEAEGVLPGTSLIRRRQCEAYTRLGQRDAAVAACNLALQGRATPMLLRAAAGALMIGPERPKTEDVGMALVFAKSAARVRPNGTFSPAAMFDIGERLGDLRMMDLYARELERRDPGSAEARRAAAVTATHGAAWWVGAGWILIALLGLVTAVHALVRTIRSSHLRRSAVAAVAALLALTLAQSPARADEGGDEDEAAEDEAPKVHVPDPTEIGQISTRFKIDDSNPEASVPTPAERDHDALEFGYYLMDLGAKGHAAVQRGNYKAAVRYWTAMSKAVPDGAAAFGELCTAYEALGEKDKALENCKKSLGGVGVRLSNYMNFVRAVLAKTKLAPTDITDVDDVIQHLRAEEATRTYAEHVACELGVRTHDIARLEACTAALASFAPNDPKTLSFQWALALERKDLPLARQIVERARSAGMKPEGIQRMERATAAAEPLWRKGARDWRIVGGIVVMIGALAALFATRRRSAAHFA